MPATGDQSHSSRQDSQQDEGEDSRSPPAAAPKLMPAPPPKENAWAKKDGVSAVAGWKLLILSICKIN